MPLSWNEIKSRAATFSNKWKDEVNEDAEAKRIEFLFELYYKYTAGLFMREKKTKKKKI